MRTLESSLFLITETQEREMEGKVARGHQTETWIQKGCIHGTA